MYKLAAWLGKRSNGIASLWLRFDGLNYQETTDTGQTRVMASTLPVLVGAMAEQQIPLHLSAIGEGVCCALLRLQFCLPHQEWSCLRLTCWAQDFVPLIWQLKWHSGSTRTRRW